MTHHLLIDNTPACCSGLVGKLFHFSQKLGVGRDSFLRKAISLSGSCSYASLPEALAAVAFLRPLKEELGVTSIKVISGSCPESCR